MKFRNLLMLGVLVVAPCVSHADELITFEGFSSYTSITTQYAGVTFSNAVILQQGTSLTSQFAPHSGVDVVTNAFNLSAPITITFATPVQFVDGYLTYNSPGVTIDAYDSSNNLLDVYNAACSANWIGSGTGCAANELGTVTGADISYVVISDGSSPFTLDDVGYSSPASTAEPSSLALLGSGVLGLAGLLRRKLAV
jgi:hypothetical protein